MKVDCVCDDKIWPLIIIGAGPAGIEAALYAKKLGFETLILEASGSIAPTLDQIGSLSFYPQAIKIMSPLGLALNPGSAQSPCFTARNYRENYLVPVAKKANLSIRFNHRVTAIGRRGVDKSRLETNARKITPFKLMVETQGEMINLLAHYVIDASGIYRTPLPLGEGRIEAKHEASYKAEIEYGVVDFKARFDEFNGKTTLLFGDCYAAFCSYRSFLECLGDWGKSTRLICIKESSTEPFYPGFVDDEFDQRAQFYKAQSLPEHQSLVSFKTLASVIGVDKAKDQAWSVELCSPKELVTLKADHLVSNYGWGADTSLWQNLQVHLCYASGAPMNYAAAMLPDIQANKFISQAMPKQAMTHPEPNFYVLGSKSYGRSPGFFMRIALGQIVNIFQLIQDDDQLNLYGDFSDALIRADQVATQPQQPVKLSDSEQKYKTIAEHLKEVVFQTDLNQRITYLSDSWTDLTGLKPEDYIGRLWQDLLYDASAHAGLAQCNAFMSSNLPEYKEEFQVKCADGSLKWVEVNAALLRDKQGKTYATIGSMLDITERVQANIELSKLKERYQVLAYRDELTGIANRLKLNEVLSQQQALFERYGTPFSVILFDVDHFKKFNDQFGHLVGDDVLVKLAERVQNTVRNTDTFGRWGGEEFLVIASNTELADAYLLAEKLRILVANSHLVKSSNVTISLGVAVIKAGETTDQLISRADKALYSAKSKGRNTTVL